MSKNTGTIRIGGASGYWGDSQEAPRQLVMQGDIDYLVFDYLAEVTMSILVGAKARRPEAGYARDFVELAMKPLLKDIKARGIRVVANAGGVNVKSCAEALQKIADDAGIAIKIGTVEGDDLMGDIDDLRESGVTGMFDGSPLPDSLISANAYLGAFPIAAALDAGADIVVTGRCVDSAVTLGPLIHEFGWSVDDYDKLASGTLAGHIIECGAQATGGNFTDWKDVADGWDDMGYPIAECSADGSFVITKPANTGGLISNLTVGEQILYEIADPSAYIVPDVVCDFTQATLTPAGNDRLKVADVRGKPPTPTYKVSATYLDGYRATTSTVITGFDVTEKAEAYYAALMKRTRRLFKERNLGDYRASVQHLVGANALWGDNLPNMVQIVDEITAIINVHHDEKDALELFSKETTGVALSMTTGRCSAGSAGRPNVTPVIAQFAFLIDRDRVRAEVTVGGEAVAVTAKPGNWTTGNPSTAEDSEPQTEASENMTEVRLIDLAAARSGDKGNNANVGLIARKAEYLPWIKQSISIPNVRKWFSHTLKGDVFRYDLPGFDAINFVLTDCLDGGGTSSLHLDVLAKTYGQQILAMPVAIPAKLAATIKKQ